MRDILLAVLALIAGLILGGAANHLRVAELEKQIADQEAHPCSAESVELPPVEPPSAAPAPIEPDGTTSPAAILQARRLVAERALKETASPDAGQLAALDEAWASMNRELQALAKQPPDPTTPPQSQVLRRTASALEILARGHERALGVLREDQRQRVAKVAVDPLAYVAPGMLDRLSKGSGP